MTSGYPSSREAQGLGTEYSRSADWHIEADLAHGLFEQEAVFGHLDGFERSADELLRHNVRALRLPPARSRD